MQDCILCRSFKCKERQETEPRSQTVVDVNPTGCRKVQRTCGCHSQSSWRATVRRYAIIISGMFCGIWRKDVYFFCVATTSQALVLRACTQIAGNLPEGTMMTTSRMMMPTIRHMRIFMSFHHICLRTRLAPLRKPCAETARLSVLSCNESRRAPRSETLLILSRMIPTVLSIS